MNSVIKGNVAVQEYDDQSIYPHFKCLSSSQFLAYEASPRDFFKEFGSFDLKVGAKRTASLPMWFGSLFSACYQDRTIDYPLLLKKKGYSQDVVDLFGFVLNRFPVIKNGHPEYPLKCHFMGWDFRATLDDYIADTLTIIENKTGKQPWTQYRADTSDQITFQNWVHWKFTGKPSKVTILNWWNTGKKTADIRTFKTRRTVKQLEEFEKRVVTVVEHLDAGNFTNPLYC